MAKKVVIDAGHGGSDPGTIKNGIVEKDYTLKISQYIANRLSELGIENALTRNEDESLDPVNRPKKAQSFFGNTKDVILISNHINAGGGDGAEIIYALRNNDALSKKIALELENSGQNVRKYYQRRLPSNPAKDYYYILRETPDNESVIIEYGFADSTKDDVSQLKNNWEIYAEAVVKSLAEYIGVNYMPVTNSDYYIVMLGDTLWSIAKKFATSVDELKKANNLTNNSLSIGQALYIPNQKEENNTISELTYKVKAGDTLYSIAKKYNTTVESLKELNGLVNNNLTIGNILIINKEPESNNDTNFIEYTIQSGDNLYAIAKKYEINVDSLKTFNNLKDNNLSIGQIIKIPLPATSSITNTHVVEPNDTLYNLSKIYNTTVDSLKKANNLETDKLTVGQLLIIPSETTYITYTVKPGDTLYSISQIYGTTVSNIESLNNLSSSILSVGQKLLLPNKI